MLDQLYMDSDKLQPEMTEIGQQSDHNKDANKQGSRRRPNRPQEGVIDVFDRLLERHKRPPERFERKFQEFIPEYGIRLPRAPALKVMSAKRVSTICDRLYSGGRCATSPSKKTSTSDESKSIASSTSHSKLHPDAKHGTSGGANNSQDKTDRFGVTRQVLTETKDNDGEEKLFDIKMSKEMRFNNEKPKEFCFNDERSKDKEIGFDDEKFNDKKSNDNNMLYDIKDNYSKDSPYSFKKSKDDKKEIQKKIQVTKVGQLATHRDFEMKGKTKSQHIIKHKSLEKLKQYKENNSDVNSDCSLSDPNAKNGSISKKKFISHNTYIKQAKYESSSFSISYTSRPDQDLALIREILGQPRPERSTDIQEKSIAKIQFEADDKEVKSDLPTVDSSKQFLTQPRSSKNILMCEPVVSRRPLSRPKRSTKLKLTKNEHMDMLMEQLYLAAKENRVPPKSLMREVLRFSKCL